MTAITAAPRASIRIPMRRWHVVVLASLIPVAGVAAYTATNVSASLAQRDLRARWDGLLQQAPMDPVALASRAVPPGEPVARLLIPAIGLDVVAVHGDGTRKGPAFVPASALPGLPGVTILKGRRFAFGNHFMHLSRLTAGDRIALQTLAGELSLVVRSVQITQAPQLDPAADVARPILILVAPARIFGSTQVVVRAESSA